MSLSDLAVYSEYAYSTMTEVLQQQTELFNTATANALILRSAANVGDFDTTAFFAKIAGGTVRRRNAYGDGAVPEKTLRHLEETSVKVAAGTPPIRIDPGQFRWIQQNPEVAGAVVGQQLAKDALADMLNTGLGATYAAIAGVPDLVYDATGNPDAADQNVTWKNLLRGRAKFGDQADNIGVWVMHSTPLHSLYANNLDNKAGLFSYGTVNVARDPFGRLLVMTDSPELVDTTGAEPLFHVLGLTTGSLLVEQNGDFDANEETKNGRENIVRTYQAEWSYNVGIKGFAWDTATGGKSPTDAALFSSANWDRVMTDIKNMAGIVIEAEASI